MKNKYGLKIFPLAKRDLEEIFDYIAVELCNPSAAIALINAFENACLFPEYCPFVNNEYVKEKKLHKLIVRNYIAFYRVKNEEIQIVRVLYGMSNYSDLL